MRLLFSNNKSLTCAIPLAIASKKVKAQRQWNKVIPEHASVLFCPAGAGNDVSVEEHGSCLVLGDKCFLDCMQVGEGCRLQDVSPGWAGDRGRWN